MLMIVKVEYPNCIRAVISAVTSADTAIVYLAVQTVRVVVAGIHRTDRLAWCVMAVLAEHRQEADPHLGIFAHPEPFDTEPMHVAAFSDFLLFADGHIVLCLTRNYAGPAARAAVEIHDHSPLVGTCHFFHVKNLTSQGKVP